MSQSRPHLLSSTATGLLILLAAVASCTIGITIAKYPAEPYSPPTDGGTHICDSGNCQQSEYKYWSAYISIENQDIIKKWGINGSLDYILIYASSKIPMADGNVSSVEYPLYLIEKGAISSSAGIDLLRKYPFGESNRDQVSIEIGVKIFKNKAVMDAVRKIIKAIDSKARSYLDNYPLASKILDTALPLIDQVAPDSNNIPPSKLQNSVISDDIKNGKNRTLTAYLLFPDKEDGKKSFDKQNSVVDGGTGAPENKTDTTYRPALFECKDNLGFLCKQRNATYQSSRVDDVVYLTIEFRAYDKVDDLRALVTDGSLNCATVTTDSLNKARIYVLNNRHLFHQDDYRYIARYLDLSEKFLKVASALAANRIGEAVDNFSYLTPNSDEQKSTNLFVKEFVSISNCFTRIYTYNGGGLKGTTVYAVANFAFGWLGCRTPPGDIPVAGETLRTDILYLILRQAALVQGLKYQLSTDFWQTSNSSTMMALQHELYEQSQCAEAANVSTLLNAKTDQEITAMLKNTSIACEDTWKAAIKKVPAALEDKNKRVSFARKFLAGTNPDGCSP